MESDVAGTFVGAEIHKHVPVGVTLLYDPHPVAISPEHKKADVYKVIHNQTELRDLTVARLI